GVVVSLATGKGEAIKVKDSDLLCLGITPFSSSIRTCRVDDTDSHPTGGKAGDKQEDEDGNDDRESARPTARRIEQRCGCGTSVTGRKVRRANFHNWLTYSDDIDLR